MAVTKPRARITRRGGQIWIRFATQPAAEIRAALKAQGAQFIARRGSWVLPFQPVGA